MSETEMSLPETMIDGEEVKVIFAYGLYDLPGIMGQLDCLDKLQAIVHHRPEDIGSKEIAFLKWMAGTLRIAGNLLLDLKSRRNLPRPSGGEGRDN